MDGKSFQLLYKNEIISRVWRSSQLTNQWDNITSNGGVPSLQRIWIGNAHCSWFVIWVNFKTCSFSGGYKRNSTRSESPEHFAINNQYVHNDIDNLPLKRHYRYIIQNNCRKMPGRSDCVFWWFSTLSEDQEKNSWIHQNYLVALTWPNFDFNHSKPVNVRLWLMAWYVYIHCTL